MTKYGLDKLKRHRVPFKSIQKIELEPARSPPSKLRHSVQKLNRGITRIFRERSRLHSIAWRHRANATDSSDNSRKIPENGFSRKEKAQQNLSTQEQKTSKSLSGRADVIVRKHTAADLTETISRPATSEKKTLPIEKLSAPAGIAPTQKNPTAPQDVSPKSKVKPKQEPRTDSLRTKQRLPTGTGSKASQRHSGLKYRAAARPTHSISKWHPAHNGPQAHPAQQRHSSLHYSNTVQSRPSPSDWRHRSTQNRFPSPPAQPTSHKKELGPSPQLQLRFANESLQSRSGREEVLNDMVFDLFTKLGVQSFAMKTIEGTLRGVADPKQTHFIPLQFVQPSSQRQSNPYAVNLRAPYNSSPQSEHNDVRVAARGALQSAATVNRTTMNRTTVRDRSGSPSPIFFRNNAGKAIPWKRTAGVTRKELRRSRMKTHRR
ncbi:hypothetical protein ANCCEY_01668 [Ancylostoma ceylanicum]|nr:hypothetical protein ANCCEY_01668 [Ancylostoma ceylanicum]